MTASTPPLVDVIAEALYDDSNTRQMGPPWSEYIKTSSRVDYWRDKARAVLDALSEAGGVKVVTGYGVKLKSGDVERCGTNAQDAKDWLVDFAGGDDPDYEPVEVVTRTTTTITIRTDWIAVEG